MTFPDFVNSTWRDDVHYTGIEMKLEGAVMPCTVSASLFDRSGNVYRSSGSISVSQEDWAWQTAAFDEAGTYCAVVNATDAAGRTVSVRTGEIAVKRRPV